MAKIVIIGSTNTDMVVKSQKIPTPGETVIGGDFFMNLGGKGANQAVSVARLSGDGTFITKVGSDLFGEQALSQFRLEGLDTTWVFKDAHAASGVALILVDSKGENCISVASGANANLLPDDIEQAKTSLESADFLLLQLEIPLQTVSYVAQLGYFLQKKIIVNPAPAQSLPDELYPLLYCITPNETEAEILTGITVTDENSAARAAHYLHQKGVENVVITLGAKGAFLSTATEQTLISAPIVKAIDTTAAGDVFNGALTVALSEGNVLREAVHFAIQAASLSVTRAGAIASVPYRNELTQG
ncbi:MAG: ribokinase [Spirosomataceae bacterium]